MEAEVIIIGDELLFGQTIDTNSAFIGQALSCIGVDLTWATTVGDDERRIEAALRQALGRVDVVIAAGGLGPTPDDVTRQAVAQAFGRKLILQNEVLRQIQDKIARWGLKASEDITPQALVPEGAQVLSNRVGIAPGLFLALEGKMLFVLPGVPREMEDMLKEEVLPWLRGTGVVIQHRLLHTTGATELALVEKLGKSREVLGKVRMAFLPGTYGIDLRLTARGESLERVEEQLAQAEGWVRERLGGLIYGVNGESLEEVVGNLLLHRGAKLAVAESCTGGLIAHRITNISGSSRYFERGVVAYSNEAKNELLGVPWEIIREHGAVSAQTAQAMAEGVRELSRADIGLGVTGIAGPTGGTPEKPIGLVYIALAHEGGCFAKQFRFFGDRMANKERTAQAALNELRLFLMGSQ